MTLGQGGYTGTGSNRTVRVWRHEGHWCLTSPRDRERGAVCDYIITPEAMERFLDRKEKKTVFDTGGYTGTYPGQLVGRVHRAEFQAPCSCGGRVHAYDNGEVISHSLPLDTTVEHRAGYPHKQQLLFDYKMVE